MLIYEYKLDISTIQEAAIKEAIQVVQFIKTARKTPSIHGGDRRAYLTGRDG